MCRCVLDHIHVKSHALCLLCSCLNVIIVLRRVRYGVGLFTTPLLLLDVLLLSGIAIGDLMWIIGADVLMIVTGQFASLPSFYQISVEWLEIT